jgi:hypothetical protein
MTASVAGINEREMESRGERREKGATAAGQTAKTGSTGPETGSTGFAVARTVNTQKKRFDCADY